MSPSDCGPMTSTTLTTTMAPITTTASLSSLLVTVTGGGVFTAGQTHTLTCQVSGGDTTMITSYQWLKNDLVINGQTSSILSFSLLGEADTGIYHCQGTRGSSTNISNSVDITVNGKLQCCQIVIY